MSLLSKELDSLSIPELYSTEHVAIADRTVHAKLYHPCSTWKWYVLEYDGSDLCFGLVEGHETELGYFSLQELSEVQAFGVPIERDRQFKPTQLQDLPIYNIERVVA